MANRKYEMYEYRQILLHMRKGESDRKISKTGLISRVKAKQLRAMATKNNWLNAKVILPTDAEIAEVLESKNKPTQHKAATHKDLIKSWVEEGLTALVIYNAFVKEHNYQGHYSSITRYVANLKKLSPSNITIPLHFVPGESAQVDFGKGPVILDREINKEQQTWFFIMTLCWSRHQYAEIVTNQNLATWLGCHKRAFEWFGGVPNKVIIDNLKSGVSKACYYEPEIQRSYAEFAEGYDFIISPCPPYDPQKKAE